MGNLMKCPFCGGEARIDINVALRGYRVACKSTLKCGAMFEWYDTEKEAVEAWNTRKPMEAVVAELENAESRELFDYKDRGATYMIPVTDAISIVRGEE